MLLRRLCGGSSPCGRGWARARGKRCVELVVEPAETLSKHRGFVSELACPELWRRVESKFWSGAMTEEYDFKVCPYCGNWVRERAFRCRHCKRWILKPVNVPITLNLGIAKIPVIGTGLVDSDYKCPKCGGKSPKGSSRCVRCKKFRYFSTPSEGAPGLVVFWDKIRNFPEFFDTLVSANCG